METLHICGLEDSLLLKLQFSLHCSIIQYNLMKVPTGIFVAFGKQILKFIQKWKTRLFKRILKKYQVGSLLLSNFETNCKVMVIKKVWYKYKDRHM